MQIAYQKGLVFNSSKCSFQQPQIIFYRAIFTAQGMEPNPSKVQVLQDFPTPQNQAMLGHYLEPFLPSLASKTAFLRKQVTHWDWHPSTDPAFTISRLH